MKTFGIIVGIFFCFSLTSFAQIDTTEWYPLNDGNYWEYTAFISPNYSVISKKVLGDTLFANGKTYKIIEQHQHGETSLLYFYERFEDNKVFFPGSANILDSSCTSAENKLYDFTLPDSAIWSFCTHHQYGNFTHRMFRGKSRRILQISASSFETAGFQDISIAGTDTNWHPLGAGAGGPVAKGVGLTGFGPDAMQYYELTGAIINGAVYGTITNLTNETLLPVQNAIEIYPNPSNNEAILRYRVSEYGKVVILLYDMLGNEVMKLTDKPHQPGEYSINVKAHQLSSGVYIAMLKTGLSVLSIKLILMK